MKTVTIHTLDGKIHKESTSGAYTLRSAQMYEDLWGEQLTMWNGSAIHREDGPAVVDADGTEQYWFAGVQFPSKALWERRKGLHSFIDEHGNRCWHSISKPGILHRDDGGPAVEYKGGQRWEWWQDGQLHREGKPAIIDNESELVQFFVDGMLHNTEGPAVIRQGSPEYYVQGSLVSQDRYYEEYGPSLRKRQNGDTHWVIRQGKDELLHRENGPALITADGEEQWYIMGRLQSVDGAPAIVKPSGTKVWAQDGKKHRSDGPAIIHFNGDREWWQNGQRHRDEGPAIVFEDGTREWWTNGILICKETDEITEYFDENGRWHSPFPSVPAITQADGTVQWYHHGQLHRTDGPAIVRSDNRKEWFKNGERHNEKGPAIVYPSGRRAWYLNGSRVTKREFEAFTKERDKDVKKSMSSKRNQILYLIYSATHRAYRANMERTKGNHAYYGGFLKSKYANDKMVTQEDVSATMAFATMAAESGYDILDSEEFDSVIDGILNSDSLALESENPYSIYRIGWAILNVNKHVSISVAGVGLTKALDIAAEDIGEPMRSYDDFLAAYAPEEAARKELEEEGSGWAAPALSILAAAAVGALTGKAFGKKKVKQKKKVVKKEQVVVGNS